MFNISIPEKLSIRINEFAEIFSQTPEEFVLELLEERLDHDSAYKETDYLSQSGINKKRLDQAVADIHKGRYSCHELTND
ncbi:MAG: hypothetical protein HQK62_03685 [Desulfamplus sp.]|nr:hypothetical protein [Desulfamplus sp.]